MVQSTVEAARIDRAPQPVPGTRLVRGARGNVDEEHTELEKTIPWLEPEFTEDGANESHMSTLTGRP